MRRVLLLATLGPLLAAAQTPIGAERELALGKQLAAAVERQAIVIKDPAITGYIDRIAQKLAASASLRTPLTVKVISGTESYAIMLPGGFCEVNARLVLEAASEAELAGVIAHQLGHLELWPKQGSDAPDPSTMGAIPMIFVGGPGGLCLRGGAGRVALPVNSLATRRQTEAKADELGLGYMAAAGYDPGALTDFYQRMQQRAPGTVSKEFDGGSVMESTRTLADSLRNARIFVVTTSQFADVQKLVAELPSVKPAAARTNAPSLKKSDR